MQARKQSAAAAAAADAMAHASGYGSDEEVYATARAVDDAEDTDVDGVAAAVDRKRIQPLPALDHASIEYDDFAKDFYEEHPNLAAMSHAEVRPLSSCLLYCNHIQHCAQK